MTDDWFQRWGGYTLKQLADFVDDAKKRVKELEIQVGELEGQVANLKQELEAKKPLTWEQVKTLAKETAKEAVTELRGKLKR